MPRFTPALALCLLATRFVAADGPPETPKVRVTDAYHGTDVTDDYRWFEQWDDPKVQAWSEAQNVYARAVLDQLQGVAGAREQVARPAGDGAGQ
jgi:prolyl oligopeptidase